MSLEPVWLEENIVVAIAEQSVARFGGFSAEIRDESLLRAALGRPLNKWVYDEPRPNLYQLAAAYCFGLARGHVFHDGNKRTAYLAAIIFLELNGVICSPDGREIVTQMYAIAKGDLTEVEIAKWLEENSN